MIVIDTFSGLCNRMRAILSAMELAERKNTKLLVLWECNDDLNASFEELFERTRLFKVISFRSKYDIRRIVLRLISKNKLFDSKIKEKRIDGELDSSFSETLKMPLYVRSCEQFYDIAQYYKQVFRPAVPIRDKIKEIQQMYGKDMVGVHIRRTDQIKSIEYSKTENFVELMNREIFRNSEVKFYLATDDIDEEKYLRKLFGNRIISNVNRNLCRNAKEGMIDAVIDLYCLASCKKIIGSYWSSFTDTAADIDGVEKIVAGIDN